MMHIVIPSQVEESLDVEPNEFALVQSKNETRNLNFVESLHK